MSPSTPSARSGPSATVDPISLAVNYSPQAAALAGTGMLHADYFKCPAWPELIRDARGAGAVYVHFNFELGNGSVGAADWGAVAAVMEETQTRYLNVHVAPRQADVPEIPVDSRDPQAVAVIRDRVCGELEPILTRFGAGRVVIENAPYRGEAGGFPRAAIVPELFAGVLERTGCGLLLDLAHATITARSLGIGVREYLRGMPVGRLIELHASGVRHDGARWRDHMGMTDDDWALFDWALGETAAGRWAQPWIVTYEYGGIGPVFEWRSEAAVLAADMPEFRRRLSG